MLNIIKSKLNIINKQKKQQKHINVNIGYKYFVNVVRDWKDSIYDYNKNNIKLIHVASNYVIKLIKG